MAYCYNHRACILLKKMRGKQNAFCDYFFHLPCLSLSFFFFFFLPPSSSLEDIISRWLSVAVNSSQFSPSCSVWGQIHLFPVSQLTCKGQLCVMENLSFLYFCALVVPLIQNGSSVIVFLFMGVDLKLDEKRQLVFSSQPVLFQKPKTLKCPHYANLEAHYFIFVVVYCYSTSLHPLKHSVLVAALGFSWLLFFFFWGHAKLAARCALWHHVT